MYCKQLAIKIHVVCGQEAISEEGDAFMGRFCRILLTVSVDSTNLLPSVLQSEPAVIRQSRWPKQASIRAADVWRVFLWLGSQGATGDSVYLGLYISEPSIMSKADSEKLSSHTHKSVSGAFPTSTCPHLLSVFVSLLVLEGEKVKSGCLDWLSLGKSSGLNPLE